MMFNATFNIKIFIIAKWKQTVSHRLHEVGLRHRRRLKGQIATDRHRIARLNWARNRSYWRRSTWQHFLFSDKSYVCLRFSDSWYQGSENSLIYKPITFENEALWYEKGYAMLNAQNSSHVFGRHARVHLCIPTRLRKLPGSSCVPLYRALGWTSYLYASLARIISHLWHI